MYKVPKKENVHLKQVKFLNDVVEFKATIDQSEGEEIFNTKVNESYVFPPHEDFVKAINKLKRPLAEMTGLIDAETMVKAAEFKATEKQLTALENYLTSKMYDITVTGIALSGEGGNRGVKITGVYDGMSIVSKKVKFTSELSFDNELEPLFNSIEEETYKYVFEGKRMKFAEFGEDPNQLKIVD